MLGTVVTTISGGSLSGFQFQPCHRLATGSSTVPPLSVALFLCIKWTYSTYVKGLRVNMCKALKVTPIEVLTVRTPFL